MSKKPLQITTGVLSLIPLVSGLVGMTGLSDPIYSATNIHSPILDSNLRFFNGLWIGVGIGFVRTIPSIEKRGELFALLWGMIFIGGIGRLLSMFLVGAPPIPFIGFTALEVVGAPLFVIWQRRVSREYEALR
jgi:hypothetical protein